MAKSFIAEVSQSLLHQVTYSDPPEAKAVTRINNLSQSLLHQVTYSDLICEAGHCSNRRMSSQSLLHQVTYSDSERPPPRGNRPTCVSIPFTSGHVFRPGHEDWSLRVYRMSQSLLHQVTYSDKTPAKKPDPLRRCLNPFYIRSRIPTIFAMIIATAIGMSQSLLHQVTYSDHVEKEFTVSKNQCLNPFYIRSRIPTVTESPLNSDSPECLNPFYIRSRIPTEKRP